VDLSWDGGATWTAGKRTPDLADSETTYLLGGAGDTWGRAWTSTNLSDASFRVRVTAVSNTAVRDTSLDWVAVKVY